MSCFMSLHVYCVTSGHEVSLTPQSAWIRPQETNSCLDHLRYRVSEALYVNHA